GIRVLHVTGVQTCALPILAAAAGLAIAARCLGSRTGTVALLGGIGLGLLASDALEGRPVGGRPRRREGAPAGGADEESREQPTEIRRASCRERVESTVIGV